VGNLVRQLVDGESGDQTNDCVGCMASDHKQVEMTRDRGRCQPVEPTRNELELTGIAKRVQGPGVNTGIEQLARAHDRSVLAEGAADTGI
jgi:hypothetical protein